MISAREKAYEIRKHMGCSGSIVFPIKHALKQYGVSDKFGEDNDSRVRAAQALGKHLNVDDWQKFAIYLLVPLYLIEPICVAGRRTGRRFFFGLFEEKRAYTKDELAAIFSVPTWVITDQLKRLV